MHLEALIEDLGGFGVYQFILVLLIANTKVTLASSMLMMVFAGVDPGWWCDDPQTGGLVNGSYQNCHMGQNCSRKFDESMVTIVTEWDLTCDKKWISNMIISIQMAGVFLGSIISGYFADGYGRKKVLFFSVLMGVIGNVITAFSVNWIMFTIMRVILGIAVGMMIAVNYLYMVEFVGKKYRALIASIPSWGVGVVLFAGLAWGIHHWKWIHLAAAGLAFPFLFGWFFVPESLRWLAVKGRLEEARQVINTMARYNKKPVPDTSILELIAAEEKALGEKSKNYSYLDLFRTKSLAKRTVLTCYIWFSLSVVYYTISFGVKKLSGDFFVNMMIMAVLELPVMPGVLFITSIFGRRWSCATLFFLTSIFCVGVAFINRFAQNEIKGTLENSFALAGRFFAITAWHIVQALTSEQYPTVIRNLSYSAQSTTARVGGVLAGQLLSLGGKGDLLPPFLAMGVLIFMSGVACLFLRETKNRALQDTMAMEFKVKASPKDDIDVQKDMNLSDNETQVLIEHHYKEDMLQKDTLKIDGKPQPQQNGVYPNETNRNDDCECINMVVEVTTKRDSDGDCVPEIISDENRTEVPKSVNVSEIHIDVNERNSEDKTDKDNKETIKKQNSGENGAICNKEPPEMVDDVKIFDYTKVIGPNNCLKCDL